MEDLVEEAFRIAIEMEKNSHGLLDAAAAMMPAGDGRVVLQRLADEERKVLGRLLQACPYCMTNTLIPGAVPFAAVPERRLLNLLRIALEEKHAAVARYEIFIDTFRDPAICSVFELALHHSRALLREIMEEYRLADQKGGKPSVNRRRKRAHIRDFLKKPSPNKHSQPFISMLDLG